MDDTNKPLPENTDNIINFVCEDEPLPEKTVVVSEFVEEKTTIDNSINLVITTSVTLYDFTINSIMIIPSTSATIYITIHTIQYTV